MTPRLEACYFAPASRKWTDLATVLQFTAETHCPTWDVRVQRITPAVHRSALGLAPNVANMQKMDEWHRLVQEAPDGTPLLLIDVDTAILRPLDDLWEQPFDLAYTTKPGARFPFNCGVIVLRVSVATKAFMGQWWSENRRMIGDAAYHRQFRQRFGGLNQSAFGALLQRGALASLDVRELPCAEWNCEDASWTAFDAARTRILHIKTALQPDDLRRAIFEGRQCAPHIMALAELWQGYKARAATAARRTA